LVTPVLRVAMSVCITTFAADHLVVVLLPPLMDVLAVEPLVVGRNEVIPLHDPQRLLRRESLFRQGERSGASACHLDQLASRDGHRRPLLQLGKRSSTNALRGRTKAHAQS